ncbi:MAG: diguanylate cyclase [Deltaproteobacteria bacterium]|nr:diguanylate cyclase [Deltaproteobacteria bacterium]
MKHIVMDRRQVLAALGAVLALAAGVIGAITGQAVWAVVAGGLGFALGGAAIALANAARTSDDQLVRTTEELARVRADLDTLQAAVAEADEVRARADADRGGDAHRVFDERSGLLDEKFFSMNVTQRVAAARRQLQPVSIVLFELDGLEDGDTELRDQAMTALGDVLRRTLRECDSACRIGATLAAAVLEDTTEAGAVWAAERVRGALHSSPVGNRLTVSAGVACYPSHALAAPELVQMAGRALEIAHGRGRDQVEIAPNAD